MNIAASLSSNLVDIDTLVLLPGNPRQGDIEAIAASLERFGQQKPIVVDKTGVIIAGNHTYQAAVLLGWEQVAAVTTDLDGADRAGFSLADNRLSDLATYDTDARPRRDRLQPRRCRRATAGAGRVGRQPTAPQRNRRNRTGARNRKLG